MLIYNDIESFEVYAIKENNKPLGPPTIEVS